MLVWFSTFFSKAKRESRLGKQCRVSIIVRLDYQLMLGKGARVPPKVVQTRGSGGNRAYVIVRHRITWPFVQISQGGWKTSLHARLNTYAAARTMALEFSFTVICVRKPNRRQLFRPILRRVCSITSFQLFLTKRNKLNNLIVSQDSLV